MIPLKDNLLAGGFPAVTAALIALCLFVFFWQLTLSGEAGSGDPDGREVLNGDLSERDDFAEDYAASPGRFAQTRDEGNPGRVAWPLSPLTAMPVAADFLHLAVNLLFLWIFGRTLEAAFGRLRFTALLAAAAFSGIGLLAIIEPESTKLVVGLGTALSGVLGAYAVLHPRAGVVSLTLVPFFATLVEAPALLLIAAWFLLALVPSVGAVVDPDLLLGSGLELLGYAAAFAVGAAAGLLARGRPLPVADAAS